MNSNYVKKCTDFLQNIPNHKLAAIDAANAADAANVATTAAVGQTDPFGPDPLQPQSKPSIDNNVAKKPPGKASAAAEGVAGGGAKRPIWRHPAAGPVGSQRQRRQMRTEDHKFVRPCCAPRRVGSSRVGQRVDCRWEAKGEKNPPPTSTTGGDTNSAPVRPLSTPDPQQTGRGDGDNVNHPDGREEGGSRPSAGKEFRDRQPSSRAGMLSEAHPPPIATLTDPRKHAVRWESEEVTDGSTDEAKPRPTDLSPVSQPEAKLFHFHPLRTLQFLSLELTNKLRNLGPEHRSLYKIAKELSIVVRSLSDQQQADEDGPGRTPAESECPKCPELQQSRQAERARHAQESAQLTEQINYLQNQLTMATSLEQGMSGQLQEHYRRMEEDITELKLSIDAKKNVEQRIINDLKRSLRDARENVRQLERDRTDAEKRLQEAQKENERKELIMTTQAMNFKKVKSELNHIYRLSTKQIEYLDDPIDSFIRAVVDSPRRQHRPPTHNYVPALHSSDCDTTTTLSIASRPPTVPKSVSGIGSDGRPVGRVPPSKSSPAITVETDSVPEESMPSLATQSDRDNSSGPRCREGGFALARAPGDSSWTGSGPSTPRDDIAEDNERPHRRPGSAGPPGINRPDHPDDNRIRQRSDTNTDGSDYSTGRLHRKSNATDKWRRGDGMHHPPESLRSRSDSSRLPASSSRTGPDRGIQYGGSKEEPEAPGRMAAPVTLDDHQQSIVELTENITLPSSPRPFRHNLSMAQLSEDEFFDDDPTTAAGAMQKIPRPITNQTE